MILQNSGAKIWKLYKPVIDLPTASQIRGKAGDIIKQEELNNKIAECMLLGIIINNNN